MRQSSKFHPIDDRICCGSIVIVGNACPATEPPRGVSSTTTKALRRESAIIGYWDILIDVFPVRFEREISASLAGPEVGEAWMDEAFSRLVGTSEYLIDVRGYEAWEI